MEKTEIKEKKKAETIGEASHRRACESLELYNWARKDLKFSKKASVKVAKHDLTVEKLIAEFALEELEKLLKEVA